MNTKLQIKDMKQSIHPIYNKECKITCACGASFAAGSTRDEIRVEVCSACHPFYTGKQKLIDSAGRVDKFKARMEASAKMKEAKQKPEVKPEKVAAEAEESK